ncbi:hypothetical protein OIU34_25480 [Pararhizobium sp. BT-229]|uniref:hypothetical protein n=1 Tax=Pararhizobium sp. BT-229 TaxID=2986923 RepID=UPI0021F79FC9|nr:hypothetical protein [Pararhizobium sp. BT-229]MCV9965234.1 hypothetical protein [Pararhizobium sp. BT-229]
MGSGNMGELSPRGAGQRGLWRLMLKLPALRGRLQILAARTEALTSLCEAYEDASVVLQQLRSNPHTGNPAMVGEYEMICSEIEAEIIHYCLQPHPSVPE